MFIGLCVNIKFSLCVLFRINAFCKAMSGVNVNLALCSSWHHAVILTSLNGSDELDNADYINGNNSTHCRDCQLSNESQTMHFEVVVHVGSFALQVTCKMTICITNIDLIVHNYESKHVSNNRPMILGTCRVTCW